MVRHAEKIDDSVDPDLSQAGYERAEKLSEIFSNVEFDAVYSTDFKRTKDTAHPIAQANDLMIQEYDHQSPDTEVRRWMDDHSGETILISGHSNSTPTFANAVLGEERFKEKFDESDYGNILIVSVSQSGAKKLLHLRY